jgi:hypothetical protein
LPTFSEPNNELPFCNSFEERDGVTPKVVKGNALCGRGALYMNNAYGMVKNDWRYDDGKDASYQGAGYYFQQAFRFPPQHVRVQMWC